MMSFSPSARRSGSPISWAAAGLSYCQPFAGLMRSICNKAALLQEGKILSVGSIEEILDQVLSLPNPRD